MQVIIASENPIKIEATRRAFTHMFPEEFFNFQGIATESGVPDQPMSDEETYKGALARAENARAAYPDADYWVGIEGGVEDHATEMWGVAWMVVLSPDKMGKGRTAMFVIPQKVAALIRKGHELGTANDMVFNRKNSKHKNGAVGILTGDVLTRSIYYEHALILALIPFKNPDMSF